MFKMVTFEGNLTQLSQGGTIVCWVCILTILRHHCKGSFTYAEKCQIGQSFTAVEGAGKGWLGPGGGVIQGDSTNRNKTMQSERNIQATRRDASKLSSVLDKIISHTACGRYDDSYLLIIS